MKKRIVLIMTAVLFGGTFAGCGGKETGNTENIAETEGQEEKKEGEKEPLTVWVWDPAFSIYSMEEAEKIYQKDHPEFDLEIIETQSADVETKIMTMVSAGNLEDLPDIFCLQDTSFQKMYENYPEVFSELNDTTIDFSKFINAKTAVSEMDGKNYGIPFDTGTSIYAAREDYLEEAGYTIEDVTDVTWEEFIEIGKVVLEKTGKPMLVQQIGDAGILFQMMQSMGKSVFEEDGTVNIVNNENLRKCISLYREMKELGILAEVNSWDQMIAMLNSGDAGGIMSGCWILASIQSAENQSGKWGVTNIPAVSGVEGATNYSNLGGSTWVISSNCKDKAAAADFFASTFGGNVEFFKTVFPSTGLVSPCIEVGESGIYDREQEFFDGQKVFQDISEFAKKVPPVTYGKYYYEVSSALGVAMQNIDAGGDIDTELKEAQDEVDFLMQCE